MAATSGTYARYSPIGGSPSQGGGVPGGGTVTSVGVVADSTSQSVFNNSGGDLTGSPVTTSGNITLTLSGQALNSFFAGPTSGGAAAPIFRPLDISDFNAGTNASNSTFWRGDGTWQTPAGGGGSASTGGFASTALNNITAQSANIVFSGPSAAGPSAPTFRSLVGADVPAANVATTGNGGITGTLPVSNGGTGVIVAPANQVFAGPTSGVSAAPAFRSLTQFDIPSTQNYITNGAFDQWQVFGTGRINIPFTPIANGGSQYHGPDAWFGKNALGTNGQIQFTLQNGSLPGSIFASQLQITTAPTGAQANGCELWQVIPNVESRAFYNSSASFGINVKPTNIVSQIGVQLFYSTIQTKPSTALGAEQIFNVSTSAFTNCVILGQAVGTSMGTSGVIAARTRIVSASTAGNTYDLNNGFITEQAQMVVGNSLPAFLRSGKTYAGEILQCKRWVDKSYDLPTATSTAAFGGMRLCQPFNSVAVNGLTFMVPMIGVPTVIIYCSGGTSGKITNAAGSDVATGAVAGDVTTQNFRYTGGMSGLSEAWDGTNAPYQIHFASKFEI